MPNFFKNPRLSIDYGKDFNFFNKLTVNSSIDGYFPDECQIIIPFSTQTVTFQLESGGPLRYSFNGLTLHGDMTADLPSESLIFENRPICKIWFKGVGIVRVEAWAVR